MARLAISGVSGSTVTLHGRKVVSFGGCNYLGLSLHPAVVGALTRGLAEFGISTSASRETTGNTTAHDQLEETIRAFLEVESAIVVPDGFTANLAAAQALSATHTSAVIDARCHRSIRESLACAGMQVLEYRHRDAADAHDKLRSTSAPSKASIWTDGVFAADGAVAPLRELVSVCAGAGAALVVDDCHGLFTLGRGGRGTLSHSGVDCGTNVILTSTLAKGVGCHGGFVAGSRIVTGAIRERATAYVCTTPVSPAIAAAAVEAFEVVQREPGLIERLRSNAAEMLKALDGAGVRVESHGTPVFAFTLGTVEAMRELHGHLLSRGFLAPVISYPDGPAPAYFRVSVSASHTTDQIVAMCLALGDWLATRRSAVLAG